MDIPRVNRGLAPYGDLIPFDIAEMLIFEERCRFPHIQNGSDGPLYRSFL